MINWKVRIKNKTFWVTIIPLVLLLVQLVAGLFGFKPDFGDLGDKLLAIVDVVFAILAALGIVVDHTTTGISDSTRAMTYNRPNDE